MKRYLLFAREMFEDAQFGWDHFVKDFENLDEAEDAAKGLYTWHVVDCNTKEIVKSGGL